MHAIEHTFSCLLADVARLSGFSEIRGSWWSLQWCLNEAPKLEKKVLRFIEEHQVTTEYRVKPNVVEAIRFRIHQEVPLLQAMDSLVSQFPAPLQRLARESIIDPLFMRYLRQLLLFCYKAQVQHDKETTQKSFKAFLETNRDVGGVNNGLANASPLLLRRTKQHVQSILGCFREKAIKPSHGPGAVTTSKGRWQKWYSQIEYLFPYSDWLSLYFNQEHCSEHVDLGLTDEHIEAKVTAVPKDTRGPRLICVHPAEAMWLQQGLRRELERCIMLYRPGRQGKHWPHGHVFFDDQTVNGRIALLSSKSGHYATLDMKEASDRISESLVQILFGRKYKWFGCCRAQKFRIPRSPVNPEITGDLNCYAPMGNATVFPVQTLVFWAICCASLQRQKARQPNAVFVFGDDIIVPSEHVEGVINDLESFGLLVNKDKSFWRGAFRESCGVDAFNGVNVTPVRWKTTLDAEQLVDCQSLSDIAMRLRIAGYEEAASTTYRVLRRRLREAFGRRLFFTNDPNHGGIAEFTDKASLAFQDAYWHPGLQWYVTPVWRLKSVEPLRSDCRSWNSVLESVCSLERTGHSSIPDRDVSRRLKLNRGWTKVA